MNADDRYLLALDRVCDAVGSLAIHTFYAACQYG
jgi:hypothetical protein